MRQDHRIDQMRGEIAGPAGLQGAMVQAMGDPSSHKMSLASPTGEPMSAAAVMTEDGTGYFLATVDAGAGRTDQTYQLWGIMADGQVVSLGVLGNDPADGRLPGHAAGSPAWPSPRRSRAACPSRRTPRCSRPDGSATDPAR